MEIRHFNENDAAEVSALIARTLRISNIKDYPAEVIEQTINYLSPETLIGRTSWMHSYVAADGGRIVGCGSIGPYWDRTDESCLFTVFVEPDCQGKGIGRSIIGALEQDEFFLRARCIEIPASKTAVGFYIKMGYGYKNGVNSPDEEGHYRLEKFR